jgi:tetratricopeptide (TPR) repeat protein
MQKSNDKSTIYRQEGNECYKKRQFLSAVLKYNQSLCFAEKNSENLGHAYANRSAVYFEMKLYEKCLANVDYALRNHYPQANVEVLNSRKEKCQEFLKNQANQISETHFELSHQISKKIPFIVGSLQLRSDTKYGRHVITNKSLSVGDVIAIEKPFCCVPIIESRFVKIPELNNYQRCNNCLRDNQLDLAPCSFCCQGVYDD